MLDKENIFSCSQLAPTVHIFRHRIQRIIELTLSCKRKQCPCLKLYLTSTWRKQTRAMSPLTRNTAHRVRKHFGNLISKKFPLYSPLKILERHRLMFRSSSIPSVNINWALAVSKKVDPQSPRRSGVGAGDTPFIHLQGCLALRILICKSPFSCHPEDCLSDLILIIATKKSHSKVITFSFCLKNTR